MWKCFSFIFQVHLLTTMGGMTNQVFNSVTDGQGIIGMSNVTGAAPQTNGYSLLGSNVALSVVLVTLATLILVVNGLNIFVIARMSKLRNATGLLMMSLSAADFGVGVSVLLPYLHMIVSHKLSTHMCNLIGFINSSTLFVSIYSITCLSLDRCISIHRPLRYISIVTPLRMKIVIATTWLLGCILWMLPIVGVGRYKFNDDEITCYFDIHAYPALWISYMATTFLPSSIIIAVCYAIIWRIACIHQNNDAMHLPPEAWNNRQQRIKANITLVVIIGAYYVTWLPYTIEHLIVAVTNVDVPMSVEIFVYVLIVVNSLWNPLIYVGTNKTFRTAAKETIFTQCLRCKPSSKSAGGYNGQVL